MGVARALRLAVPLLAAAVGVAGAANPPRATGGIVFGAATPVDAQRVATAPALRADASGGFWLGSRGAATLIRRSVDAGETFHATSPLGAPAGAQVDVVTDERGLAYAAFPAGADAVGVGLSTNGGHAWGEGAFAAPGALSGRISVAVDSGVAGDPSDDGVFVALRTGAGPFVYSSPGGGLPYSNSARTAEPLSAGERCGRLLFDPVRRMLYLPCVSGGGVEVLAAPVELGRLTDLEYAARPVPSTPGGISGVPALAVDRGGNVYAVWVDAADHDLYYAASRDEGRAWTGPHEISGEGAETGALPVAVGGFAGTFAVAWLAAEQDGLSPESLPSTADDPRAASAFPWHVFYALVQSADRGAPAILQQRVTAKPVHYGRVCASCAGGDPLLGDSLGLDVDRGVGAATVVFPDTSNQHHAPLLHAARQAAGQGVFGQSVSRPLAESAVGDFTEDAPWPAFSPQGGGPNQPQLDLTRVELSQPLPTTLRVRMTVSSLAGLAPPPGKAAAVWLTRFQVLGTGARGENVYRVVYAGAESVGGAGPTFFGGSTMCDSPCSLLRYPAAARAAGSVAGNTITVDIRLSGGFGAGVELQGDRLLNVSGHSFGRNAPDDVYAAVDATQAFDYRLDQRIGPTTGRGRRITVAGTIRTTGSARATVAADVYTSRRGRLSYRDARAGVVFRSTAITRATVRGRTATITGRGLVGTRQVGYVATVVDPVTGRDRFSIRLSSGYRNGGRLLSGAARIR
jgi:hypothetical protein